MITDINSEDRLVQETFAEHLRDKLGWESVYPDNTETFGPGGRLGRVNEREKDATHRQPSSFSTAFPCTAVRRKRRPW